MNRIELLDFQREASEKLVESALEYFASGPDRSGGRDVPFVGQLKAVTGAGKTPILASIVSRLKPAIVLWTTKFGSVVDQTFANLRLGGKYAHLLGGNEVEVVNFAEIPSQTAWQRILHETSGLTVIVSTVAAWNSSEKDERLNVHRVKPDWGPASQWDQLRLERKRPLWVVYDEAHNTTTEQVELLDDLDPAGFFVAGASPLKGKLLQYLSTLSEDSRKKRIVSVSTRAVVEAELLKSTISVADYDSSVEEMLSDVVACRDTLTLKLAQHPTTIVPKAIYVVEASNTSAAGQEARPIALWRTLTQSCNVKPQSIAICTNTKNLPKDAIRVQSIDQLSDEFTHIIFNKKLQEGWDDPSVYVCYFDGKTESATRIQQVIGRALRQPGGKHLPDEELNTAHFFINCPNDSLEEIIDDLKEELRIYKDDDAPDDFQPFVFKEKKRALPEVPIKDEFFEKLAVPALQLELPVATVLEDLIAKKTYDFGEEDRVSPGKALIKIVSVKTGEVAQQPRDLFEDMRVSCGTFLYDQIKIQSKNCSNSLHPDVFQNAKLIKSACYKSKALNHYQQLAVEVVQEYENHVQLKELSDPEANVYQVGDFQPSGTVQKEFTNAAHAYYDSKAFNDDELKFAKALDKTGFVWVRNKDRVGYGIPLPVKSGSSSTFYPDFLWWVNGTVWAIDPTGRFILHEKIRTKLLHVPAPLKIALVTRGKWDAAFKQIGDEGWSVVYNRLGLIQPEHFDAFEQLLQALVAASAPQQAKTRTS